MPRSEAHARQKLAPTKRPISALLLTSAILLALTACATQSARITRSNAPSTPTASASATPRLTRTPTATPRSTRTPTATPHSTARLP